MTKEIASFVGSCPLSIVNLIYYSACSQATVQKKYICITCKAKDWEIQSHQKFLSGLDVKNTKTLLAAQRTGVCVHRQTKKRERKHGR
jgi:hypothetical protein